MRPTGGRDISPNPPERKVSASSEACLEREAQTEPGYEWIDGEGRQKVAPSSRRTPLGYFRNGGLRVGQIEEIDRRSEVPAVIQHKLPGKTKIELVYAGQTLDPRWLEDNRLRALV